MDFLSGAYILGASKLASTYFTLFYRSVHVLHTGLPIVKMDIYQNTIKHT